MNTLTTFPSSTAPTPRAQCVAIAAVAIASAVGTLWPNEAGASQALVQRNSCVACHQPAARVVGPSWKEITEKYGGGKLSADELAASIKGGSTGKWGPMSMPPQAQVSDADLKSIARWLLDGAR